MLNPPVSKLTLFQHIDLIVSLFIGKTNKYFELLDNKVDPTHIANAFSLNREESTCELKKEAVQLYLSYNLLHQGKLYDTSFRLFVYPNSGYKLQFMSYILSVFASDGLVVFASTTGCAIPNYINQLDDIEQRKIETNILKIEEAKHITIIEQFDQGIIPITPDTRFYNARKVEHLTHRDRALNKLEKLLSDTSIKAIHEFYASLCDVQKICELDISDLKKISEGLWSLQNGREASEVYKQYPIIEHEVQNTLLELVNKPNFSKVYDQICLRRFLQSLRDTQLLFVCRYFYSFLSGITTGASRTEQSSMLLCMPLDVIEMIIIKVMDIPKPVDLTRTIQAYHEQRETSLGGGVSF